MHINTQFKTKWERMFKPLLFDNLALIYQFITLNPCCNMCIMRTWKIIFLKAFCMFSVSIERICVQFYCFLCTFTTLGKGVLFEIGHVLGRTYKASNHEEGLWTAPFLIISHWILDTSQDWLSTYVVSWNGVQIAFHHIHYRRISTCHLQVGHHKNEHITRSWNV